MDKVPCCLLKIHLIKTSIRYTGPTRTHKPNNNSDSTVQRVQRDYCASCCWHTQATVRQDLNRAPRTQSCGPSTETLLFLRDCSMLGKLTHSINISQFMSSVRWAANTTVPAASWMWRNTNLTGLTGNQKHITTFNNPSTCLQQAGWGWAYISA